MQAFLINQVREETLITASISQALVNQMFRRVTKVIMLLQEKHSNILKYAKRNVNLSKAQQTVWLIAAFLVLSANKAGL